MSRVRIIKQADFPARADASNANLVLNLSKTQL